MIAELVVVDPPGVLVVELDVVAVTQLERPGADVPLRGLVAGVAGVADDDGGALDDLLGEHVLLSLVGGTSHWWQRPGPAVRIALERHATPVLDAALTSLV